MYPGSPACGRVEVLQQSNGAGEQAASSRPTASSGTSSTLTSGAVDGAAVLPPRALRAKPPGLGKYPHPYSHAISEWPRSWWRRGVGKKESRLPRPSAWRKWGRASEGSVEEEGIIPDFDTAFLVLTYKFPCTGVNVEVEMTMSTSDGRRAIAPDG